MRIRPFFAALLAVTACAGDAGTRLPLAPSGGFDAAVTVTFDGAPPITAEVARTAEQRRRGLMQRTSVPEGTGMVFLFAEPIRTGFWMKGTLVPLSVAYVLRDTVVSTAEMTPCTTSSCPSYPPAGPYTIAVEAPAGFFPRYGVTAGTRMRITGATGVPDPG